MIEKTASWTPHPISERDLAEEQRVRVARRRVGSLFALASLGLCPYTCLFAFTDPAAPTFLVGPLIAFLLGIEFWRRTQKRSTLNQARQKALFDEYRTIHGGWVVDLTIYQGSAPTGKDQGVVWFEDGRLYFSGYRTSFALASSEVRGKLRSGWRIDGLRSALTLDLSKTTVRKLSLGFDVVDSSAKPPGEFIHGLLVAIYDWSKQNAPAETQWPPLAVGPGAPSTRILLARAIAGSAFWVFVATLAFSWSHFDATILFALLFVIFCPEVWLPHRRWLAYRDRRRLDRSRP